MDRIRRFAFCAIVASRNCSFTFDGRMRARRNLVRSFGSANFAWARGFSRVQPEFSLRWRPSSNSQFGTPCRTLPLETVTCTKRPKLKVALRKFQLEAGLSLSNRRSSEDVIRKSCDGGQKTRRKRCRSGDESSNYFPTALPPAIEELAGMKRAERMPTFRA